MSRNPIFTNNSRHNTVTIQSFFVVRLDKLLNERPRNATPWQLCNVTPMLLKGLWEVPWYCGRAQWVNSLWSSDAIWRQRSCSTLVQVMACCLTAPKAITWTNVDWSSVKSSDIHIRAISQEMPQPSITKIYLKITCLKFHSKFPGANELTFYGLSALFVNCLQNRYEAHACKMIQVTSRERHGVSCNRQLDCLHSLLMITKKRLAPHCWLF